VKLREAFALGLGIAVPLWLRQRRVEQALVATQRQFQYEVNEVVGESFKGFGRWADHLQKEIQGAFKEQA
jgi:hypothetical protein